MYYEDFSPHASLTPFIRRYFYISVKHGTFHFPADGCPGLIINLGEPFLLGFEQGHLTKIVGCRLFGSQTRNLLTKHMAKQTRLLAVKFNPGQLTRFFNIPAIELTDTSASLQALWGNFGKEVEHRLLETKSVLNRLRLLDNTFQNRLFNRNGFDARISAALHAVWRSSGRVRIRELAGKLELSPRHLDRRFLDCVGLTPKRMCRIVRFLGVFSFMNAIGNPDWADLAIASGYSDQAHLVRECKYFTGHSPGSYVKNRSSLVRAIIGTADTMSHFFNTTGISSHMMPRK